MRKKFFIKALTVCLLLTLFSCSNGVVIEKGIEGVLPPTLSTAYGYKQRVIRIPSGTLYEIITPRDTFLVFGVYNMGMSLLKQSPVK